MSEAKFIVSLRIVHPTRTHEAIARTLGLKLEFAHTVGQLRKTPKGRALEGTYESTYCCFTLLPKRSGNFIDGIEELLPLLNSHEDFLKKINSEGGKAELFVGVFVEQTTGFSLEIEIMSVLVDLSVELSVEFYY